MRNASMCTEYQATHYLPQLRICCLFTILVLSNFNKMRVICYVCCTNSTMCVCSLLMVIGFWFSQRLDECVPQSFFVNSINNIAFNRIHFQSAEMMKSTHHNIHILPQPSLPPQHRLAAFTKHHPHQINDIFNINIQR